MERNAKTLERAVAGRPPKHPLAKVGRPVRALVTYPVMEALEAAMQVSQINLSETLRLAIYQHLNQLGLLDEQLQRDPTWDNLRQKGLVK
jgi:hypothetical protein